MFHVWLLSSFKNNYHHFSFPLDHFQQCKQKTACTQIFLINTPKRKPNAYNVTRVSSHWARFGLADGCVWLADARFSISYIAALASANETQGRNGLQICNNFSKSSQNFAKISKNSSKFCEIYQNVTNSIANCFIKIMGGFENFPNFPKCQKLHCKLLNSKYVAIQQYTEKFLLLKTVNYSQDFRGGAQQKFFWVGSNFLGGGAKSLKIAKFPVMFAIFSQKREFFLEGGPGPTLATPVYIYLQKVELGIGGSSKIRQNFVKFSSKFIKIFQHSIANCLMVIMGPFKHFPKFRIYILIYAYRHIHICNEV